MRITELLESFDEQKHPRGFHGRWLKKVAGLVDVGGPPRSRVRVPDAGGVMRPGPRTPGQLTPRNVVPGDAGRARRARIKSDARRRYEGGVSRMSQGTRARLRAVFTPAERAREKGRQPHADLGKLYTVAGRHQSHFEHILDRGRGIAKRLGARVQSTNTPAAFRKAQEDVAAHPDEPHVIIAALKGRKRAGEKAAKKYGGDAGRLTDLVRGTVLVPHVDDLPKAIEAIRAELPKGWKISAPENRYVHEPGDKVNTGAKAGYRDISVLLVSPEGFHTELQVNTTHMWLAKEVGVGHTMYERLRAMRESAQAEQRDLSAAEVRELRNLERKSRELYDKALMRSSRPHKMPARR